MDQDHVLFDHLDVKDVARSIRVDAGALLKKIASGLQGADKGSPQQWYVGFSGKVPFRRSTCGGEALLDDDCKLTQSGYRE